MSKKFKVGDRVHVVADVVKNGEIGEVVDVEAVGGYPICVSFDGDRRYFTADELKKTKKTPKGPQTYKGNGKHGLEPYRTRVPGGWLYRIWLRHDRPSPSCPSCRCRKRSGTWSE